MKLTRVGVDLAKNILQLHGVDRAERAVWCKRLRRNRWIKEIEQNVEPGVEIGMEACGGAHHWARLLQSKGYRVRLIAPQFVKPSGMAGGCVQRTDGAVASAAFGFVRGSTGPR